MAYMGYPVLTGVIHEDLVCLAPISGRFWFCLTTFWFLHDVSMHTLFLIVDVKKLHVYA